MDTENGKKTIPNFEYFEVEKQIIVERKTLKLVEKSEQIYKVFTLKLNNCTKQEAQISKK